MTPKPQEYRDTQNNGYNGETPVGEHIVISGMAGLYPKSHNLKEWSNILYNKINPVEKTDRWRTTHPEASKYVGIIPDLEYFDAQFFKVHHRLSNLMDPMSRKLLEQTYQAIFDAGYSPDHLSGKKVGVFVGTCFSETEKALFYVFNVKTGLGITGCNRSMFSNRISYYLNLKGPSMSVDTSCCSSTTALEMAYDAIVRGECEAAIVGGSNLCLHPQTSVHYGRVVDICKDGKTKSFDANADGFCKSEAVNVIFLQKAKDALRAYARVVHVKSEFMSLPQSEIGAVCGFNRNPADITRFLKTFYEEANVSPRDVQFVEAFGAGSQECDKAELVSIDDFFCKGRPKPLKVGSVMSNIGYVEAASGLSSITKVLLGYHHGKMAANLNYLTPRDDIPAIRDGRIQILSNHEELIPTCYTAINSFSMTGKFGHILLQGYNKKKDIGQYTSILPRLVLSSGRQETSVEKIFNYLKSKPIDPEELALLNHFHEKNIGGHLGRGFIILATKENNETVSLHEECAYFDQGKRPLWFVYSGMGSQWTGMGKALMRIPVFAAAIERCQRVLEPKGVNIIDIITSDDKKILDDNIINSFVGLNAIQIGLTDVLRSLGIVPDNIIGHSMGELGCAYADGCFTAEETIQCAYSRGLVSIQTPLIRGSMAAVGLGYKEISKLCPPEIEVACHNSALSSTISGPADIMKEFLQSLKSKGIFAKEVPCSNIAYHSRYISDAGPGLKEIMQDLIKTPRLRSSRWVSTSVPQDRWDEPDARYSSAEYHTNSLLNPVLFEETSQLIPPDAVLIEVAPHGLLQAILKRSLPQSCKLIPLTRREHHDNCLHLLQAIGQLYMEGYNPKIQALYPQVQFPVSTSTPMLSHLVDWVYQEKCSVLIPTAANKAIASISHDVISICDKEHSYLKGHILRGKNLYPFSAALVAVWDTLAASLNMKNENLSVQFENVYFYVQPILHKKQQMRPYVAIKKGNGRFEVINDKSVIMTGNIIPEITNERKIENIPTSADETNVSANDIYRLLSAREYQYLNDFRSIHSTNESLSEAQIHWKNNWVTFLDGIIQLNILKRKHISVSKLNVIKKITIDVNKQRNSTFVNNDAVLINAKILELYDVTICGGVIMESIKFVDMPVLKNDNMKLKICDYLPLFSTAKINEMKSFHMFLQIVADNTNINSKEKLSIADTCDGDIKVQEIINSIPGLNANYFKKNFTESKNFYPNIDLIVTYNLLSNDEVVQKLKNVLTQNTFIINKNNIVQKESPLYTVVGAHHNTEGGILELAIWRPSKPDILKSLVMRAKSDSSLQDTPGGEYYIPLDVQTDSKQGASLRIAQIGDLDSLYWVNEIFDSNQSGVKVKVSYVGVNVVYVKKLLSTQFHEDNEQNKSIIDFSGFTGSGTRVMGLAYSDTVSSQINANPELLLSVPEHWTLEDAATVPLAYSMAFYILFIKVHLTSKHSICVQGATGALGQAIISVALAHGSEVFATISFSMTPKPQEFSTSKSQEPDASGERVVISGIAGLYPSCYDVKELSEVLYNKVNPIKKTNRWQYNHPEVAQFNGNVPDLSYFDAQFFKVHYRLCNSMDAMARKILEQSYQAIYDAGVSPEHLSGKKVGVYIGTCFSETEKACFYVASSRTGFGIAGCNKSMFANRISYWLNAKGPSMSVDEACCSSTAALELAYNAIARGDCEAAIVGGGNLCLHPQSSVHYGRIMKLSMDGKTRSFDMDAAGCAKSEAINVLFLQKAKDALRIYADVVHVKSEFCSLIETKTGPKYGFYRDPKDTTRFLNNFYEEANISPQAVEYVEAFGSAVPEADKSELEAIDAVFCKDRKKPLLVGSVMSNVGYGEAASGITAITKVVLGYYYGKLAGNLNCETPRKDVPAIRDGRIQIVTEHTKIDRTYAAVNCLSITGINGHVLLHGHYKPKDLNRYKASIPRIVLLSGRQESSVRKIINDLKSRPIDPEEHALLHNIHDTRISGHLGRGFVILDTNENNETVSLCEVSDYCDQGKRPLWFVYSGMGSQWVGMGKALMRIPIFAAAIEKCHRVLHPRGVNIIDIITSDDKNIFDNILHSFVGITAIQIGLTDVLKAMDIHPDNIIGHSLGEIGCSYADGCFTTEETILCSYSRGLVSIQTPFIHGSMAAVGLGYKEIINLLPPEIEVACHNSSQSCTISGPAEIMSVFVKSLTDKKIFAKEVPCSNIAYHSRYIANAGPALYDYMSKLIKNPKLRSPRWLSTSVPQEKWGEPAAKYCSAEYHTNNLLNSVLFEETSQLIPPDAVLIEIAPHSLLQAILKRSLPESCRLLPLTRRGHPDNVQMVLETVGKLSMEGFLPKVKALYPKIEFPVSTSTPMLSHLVEWAHQEKWTLALYAAANRRTAAGSKYIISTHDDENSYLKGHVIGGKIRYPFAAALVSVWDTFAMSLNLKPKSLSVQFSDIHFYSQPVLHDQRQLRINVTLHRGSGRFEVMNQNSMVIQGIISNDNIISRDTVPTLNSKINVNAKDIYQLLYARDYQYNYDFQSIHSINETLTEAQIEWKENWVTFLDGIFQLNILKRNHDTVSKLNFIRKLVIDVEKHSKIEPVKKNELLLMNANVLEVYDSTICGGVVLESVKFIDLPVVNETSVVLSKLTRAPFFHTKVLTEKSALSLFLQIVADNVMKREINVFEIPNKYKDYSEFNNIIEDVINIVPDIKANYLKMNIVNILDNNQREFLSTLDLILVSNLLDDTELIQALYGALPQNTFFVNKQTEHLSSRQHSELYFIVSELNVGDAILYLAIWRPTSPDPLRSLVIRSSRGLPETKTLEGEYYLPIDTVLSSEHEGMLTATSPGDLNSLVWVKTTHEIESDVDIKVSYVGVNTAFTKKFSEPNYMNKESVQTNNVFDFSGITNSGTRVMGVVQSDTIASRLRSHSDLLWPVPDHWSLEEAATIPLAYSMAFYILFIKSCLIVGAPILIHGGAGALGQALISIALAHGCEVFTTVSNNAKKQFLRKLFPKLKNEHIGNSRDVTFCDMVLNETKGKGCRTVVTCTKGYLKNICSKCCAYTGFVIDVAQIQNREDFKFGLHSLILERQYVLVDFTSVFKPEFAEDLKTLRTMMIKGIQDGFVRPLSHVKFGAHDVSRAFHMQATGLNRGRILLDMQHLNLNILPRLTCSPSSWQFLLSDDEMLALKIAERLLKQGAKKIVLLLKGPSKSVIIQTRFWSRDGVEVKIINDNIWKESSWLTCIQQCKGSPVETVFLITSDEETGNINGIVEKLSTIVQKSCPFLKYFTLVSAGAFQNKPVPKFVPLQDKTINVTLPTVNTTYKEGYKRDNTLAINNAIDVLESAVVQAAHSNEKNILVHFPAAAKKSLLQQLMNIAGINEAIFLRSESQDKTLKDLDVDQTRLSALQRYLSDVYDITWKVEDIEVLTIKMISELEKEIVLYDFKESNGLGSYFSSAVADELLSTTEMIFLPTLTTCSSMRDDEFDATETYLCIVPGVEGQHSRFRDMCERLKLPALVLQPGLTNPQESVAELASRYAQTVLKKTELKDKFYLLGYESGVLVALEMAAILEQNGLTGTVFCIGGSPTEILANFKQHLSEYKTKEELQVAVLKHMYTMMTNESTTPLDHIVTKNLSWSEKVNACLHTLLGKIPHPIQFAKELIEAAYARLAVMLQHTPKPKLLRSQVISVRPRYFTSVDSSLQNYSSKKVISYQLEAPLSCAPRDLMCAAIINRHLDDDILENFNSRSHCETYLLNANTFMTTEHDIE